ncbi:hypothetical protein HYC85_013865 [Camellia sinensis]|uniref:DM2 domain-containing protein n=1 Tax=Camellia sinensis TaxID=4442 RepID=A0A7J7H829_CAMSI|nr:hypothetical protein HYC85_013865 [Camellia sinensis]
MDTTSNEDFLEVLIFILGLVLHQVRSRFAVGSLKIQRFSSLHSNDLVSIFIGDLGSHLFHKRCLEPSESNTYTEIDAVFECLETEYGISQEDLILYGQSIVDFCCGANDFSCLMKKKLDKTWMRCSYKNYDVLQAKNDFNFEKRDWMTVHLKELPIGSQLKQPTVGKN